MRPRLFSNVSVALTLIMAGSSSAPPPSDIHRLFPDDAWGRSCRAVQQLFDPEKLREYRIYVFPKVVGGGYIVEELYGETLRGPDAESWLFFVDEAPPADWGHPCRVVFVTTDAYEVTEYACQFPPANFDEFWDVTKEALAFLHE